MRISDQQPVLSSPEALALGKTCVQQNVRSLIEWLQKYPPFNQMELCHLSALLASASLRFYAAGESVIAPEAGVVDTFYIVKQGQISGQRASTETFFIGMGECFPLAALVGERATRTLHVAHKDTFCLCIPKVVFVTLFQQSEPLRAYALRGVSQLLDNYQQQMRQHARENVEADYSLDMTVRELLSRPPVMGHAALSIREAVKIMNEAGVGSIVLLKDQQVVGIFTLRDLRRVIAEHVPLDSLIASYMTPEPFSVSIDSSIFEVALNMADRQIAHVCVHDAEQALVGVISERDLFALQRINLVHLSRAIRHATDLENLIHIRQQILPLMDRMLSYGANASQVTHLIARLNDHTVARVIEFYLPEFGEINFDWQWICFGSEARHEQSIFTDQDNGIIFAANSEHEAQTRQALLLPLAKRVNAALDACGFEWCQGNIMACNPELCLSEAGWRSKFSDILQSATSAHLLHSTIFLDNRGIWQSGDKEWTMGLKQFCYALIESQQVTQRMMAQFILHYRPPLGFFREFIVSTQGEDKNTLDLKVQGLSPFVDSIRLLALVNNVHATNTVERIKALIFKEVINVQDGAAYIEAFEFIQLLRLTQHRQQAKQNIPYSNRLSPESLNHLDRRILRESFRQIQRLQQHIGWLYRLSL